MSKSCRLCIQAIIWLIAALSFGACVPSYVLCGNYGLAVWFAVNTIMDICLSARYFICFRKERKNKNG